MDGLNRYDGSSIKVYHYDQDDPSSISHNSVRAFVEDQSGNLWIGTLGGGLNRFDRETATFTHYRHNSADPYSLSADTVCQVFEGE